MFDIFLDVVRIENKSLHLMYEFEFQSCREEVL